MNTTFLALVAVCLTGITHSAIAADTIIVEVFTEYEKTAAIGFEVKQDQHGSMGRHTKGKGPANETYFFGMRLGSIFGKSLGCGKLVLAQNSKVRLEVVDNACYPKIVSDS